MILRTIADTLLTNDSPPAPWFGNLQISWEAGATGDGLTLAAGAIVRAIPASGAVSVSLAPGILLTVRYLPPGKPRVERWLIPAGAGPFTVADVLQ